MAVTIQKIAELSGVSRGTVDRAGKYSITHVFPACNANL